MIELAAWAGSIGLLGGTVIALGSFFGGTFFRAWIEKSIQAKFDRDIEEVRSQVRKNDHRIESIRNSALSAAAHSNDILTKRRIDAIERLWATSLDLQRYKFPTYVAKHMNMDEALKLARQGGADGESLRQFAENISRTVKLEEFPPAKSSDVERLFVSEVAWAMFSAYRTIITIPILQFASIQTGLGESLAGNHEKILDVVKAALPHRKAFIDLQGTNSLNFLVDELEEKLFSALRESLENPSTDAENVARAAEIMRAVESATANPEAHVSAKSEPS